MSCRREAIGNELILGLDRDHDYLYRFVQVSLPRARDHSSQDVDGVLNVNFVQVIMQFVLQLFKCRIKKYGCMSRNDQDDQENVNATY